MRTLDSRFTHVLPLHIISIYIYIYIYLVVFFSVKSRYHLIKCIDDIFL